MNRKRYTPEQIIGKLREAEVALAQGQTAGQVCRALGIAEQTFYRWRREYGGLKVEQAKRLKALEQENNRLRRAVADLTLDKLILQKHKLNRASQEMGSRQSPSTSTARELPKRSTPTTKRCFSGLRRQMVPIASCSGPETTRTRRPGTSRGH